MPSDVRLDGDVLEFIAPLGATLDGGLTVAKGLSAAEVTANEVTAN